MNNPPSGYICKICNIPGHWIQKCPSKYQSSTPRNYVCKICNIPGHWIQQCPNKKTIKNPPPNDYICNKCHKKGHWFSDCTLKFSIPPSTYICKICNTSGHWIQRCPNKLITFKSAPYVAPKCKTYHVDSDEYCQEECKYCKDPKRFNNYLVEGYSKANTEDLDAPQCVLELIWLFFDTTSKFIEAWKNRNDYLMSYSRVHGAISNINDFLSFYNNGGKSKDGIVIYENGAIYCGYNGGETQNEFRINYEQNKCLNKAGLQKLKELLNKHGKNEKANIESGIIDCNGGFKLTQTFSFKIDNKIECYDACNKTNKNSDLWQFLNNIYDIFHHDCNLHTEQTVYARSSNYYALNEYDSDPVMWMD